MATSKRWYDSTWPWVLAGVILLAAYASVRVGVQEGDPRPVGSLAEIEALSERDDVNVLFVLIDTLRAHRLGSYGYERDTDPTLGYLGDTGVRFFRHLGQSSWTKASMASLWTGLEPPRAGVTRFDHAVPEEARMPAEVLSEAGFRTAGIWRNGWVAPNFGFSQGFEVYTNPSPGRPPASVRRNSPHVSLEGTDRDVVLTVQEFLRAFGDQRWFLYLHLMDVHQYVYDEASALFGSDYTDLYDNSVRHVDNVVAELLGHLAEMGLVDETLVVIAVDHGEAFGERGIEGHAKGVYMESTEIPFIISFPFRLETGVSVETRTGNVDVWPTLLELLGLPALEDVDGRSRVPEILAAAGGKQLAEVEPNPAYAHLDRTWGRPSDASLPHVAVALGDHRLIKVFAPEGSNDGAEYLYDAATDPAELVNVAETQPEILDELRGLAEAYVDPKPAPWGEGATSVEVDELQLNQLRALGYAIP